MKKYSVYLVIFLICILSFVAWWLLTSRPTSSDSSSQPGIERTGPAFQNEGSLYFIHPETMDTVKSIFIEIADNPEEIRRGMMYRNSMKTNEGMLFIFDSEEEQTFWMKNTRISLDIIFINNDHRIVNIAKHTIPYSTDPIPSMQPARYVLEVNGGFCDQQKIEIQYIVQFTLNKSLSL
jgi:uncharacterized membrane protein (UPF0127 family)